jgi:hypothetical protein
MELVTRTTRTQHLHGAPVTRIPRPKDLPPTYPAGRICSRPSCDHPLSIYNKGPECHACWMASLPAEEREAA